MSWISEYLTYRQGSGSRASFDLFAGLTALGAAMGRKVWLETGHLEGRLYPNLYTVLVASPGSARSSTSIMTVRNMLDAAGSRLMPSAVGRDYLVRAARTSVRKVGDYSHSSIALLTSEFSVMLTDTGRANSMLGMLNDWFDCPLSYTDASKRLSGTIVNGVFLSVLGAATQAQLRQAFTREDLIAGLASRMLFVVAADVEKRQAFRAIETGDNDLRRVALENYLHRVESGPVAAMRLSSEARAAYREWYEGDSYGASIAIPPMQAYLARRQVHVLKLAMIVEYSEAFLTRGAWPPTRVSAESFERALALVQSLEPRMPLAFGPRERWVDYFSRQALLAHVAAQPEGATIDDLRRAYNAAVAPWQVDKAVADLAMLGHMAEGKDGRLRATGKAKGGLADG